MTNAESIPRYYIFHGQDELARSEAVDNLKSKLGSPELVELNTTVLDGAEIGLAELRGACDAMPFMAKRRLVIVKGLLTRLAGKSSRGKAKPVQKTLLTELIAYLPQLPDTTRLVFIESDPLMHNHPVLKLAQQDNQGYVRDFAPPKNAAQWIRHRAKDRGGDFTPQAAAALAQMVGSDQRLLDQEILKLLSFVNNERPVGSDDVALLVPQAQQANVFELVDALGQRDGVRAIRFLHHLLDNGQPALYLFSMIVRQFRLLIQIKELAEQSMTQADIAKALKLHPFPARKLYTQSRNFTLEQLETVYNHLLQTDIAIKTGQIQDVTALDLFVAGLAPPD